MSDTWTLRDWIIRGLVASCISTHTLYRWYCEQASDPVDKTKFALALYETIRDRLVYPQRDVPCYEHEGMNRGRTETGWALTDAGQLLDPTLRSTHVDG